jgi:hypothetical protein
MNIVGKINISYMCKIVVEPNEDRGRDLFATHLFTLHPYKFFACGLVLRTEKLNTTRIHVTKDSKRFVFRYGPL